MNRTNIVASRRELLDAEVARQGLSIVARLAQKPASQIKDMIAGRKTFGDSIAIEIGPRIRPDLPKEWLVYPPAHSEANTAIPLATQAMPEAKDIYSIPYYETNGKTDESKVLLADQPGLIRKLEVSREWIEKNIRGYTSPQNLYLITGFDSAMRGMFNPGDPIIIDCGHTICDVDAPYFFRIGKQGFARLLQRIPVGVNKVIIRAKSKNPDYEPFDITEDMDFEIYGRVLKVWEGKDF